MLRPAEGALFRPEQPGRRAGRNGTPSAFMLPEAPAAALKGCGIAPPLRAART
jgi:hypothetical protein